MPIQSTRFYTGSKNSTFTVNVVDNVMQLTLKVNPGASCTVLGNYLFDGEGSSAISLSEGDTLTLSGKPGAPLDGLSISPSGGDVIVVMEF